MYECLRFYYVLCKLFLVLIYKLNNLPVPLKKKAATFCDFVAESRIVMILLLDNTYVYSTLFFLKKYSRLLKIIIITIIMFIKVEFFSFGQENKIISKLK